MPDPRYGEVPSFGPIGGSNRVFRSWATPSAEGAIIGVIIYSAILLVSAYLIYRVKQAQTSNLRMKSNISFF